METNIEEGVVATGTLLNLIIVLVIIVAIVAAVYSGFLEGFFKMILELQFCLKNAKGDIMELLGCIVNAILKYFG